MNILFIDILWTDISRIDILWTDISLIDILFVIYYYFTYYGQISIMDIGHIVDWYIMNSNQLNLRVEKSFFHKPHLQ